MISERRLAETFTSFWRQVLPRGEAVVRHVNSHLETFDQPLASDLDPSTRAWINEAAFRLFVRVAEGNGGKWSPPDADELERIWGETSAFLTGGAPGSGAGPATSPAQEEVDEVLALGRRLLRFFEKHEAGGGIVASPGFPGCGILRSARGDVQVGETLYEVKARAGNFHLVDFRQLVVYCALDRLRSGGGVRRIGLVNPRTGAFFREDAGRILLAASGTDPSELLADVAQFLSREGASG